MLNRDQIDSIREVAQACQEAREHCDTWLRAPGKWASVREQEHARDLCDSAYMQAVGAATAKSDAVPCHMLHAARVLIAGALSHIDDGSPTLAMDSLGEAVDILWANVVEQDRKRVVA